MPRFTIRDLLWLMAVAALTAGWWTERRNADARLITVANHIAGQWALEVNHPVKYTISVDGNRTMNFVIGP